jgi:hypothetical protein
MEDPDWEDVFGDVFGADTEGPEQFLEKDDHFADVMKLLSDCKAFCDKSKSEAAQRQVEERLPRHLAPPGLFFQRSAGKVGDGVGQADESDNGADSDCLDEGFRQDFENWDEPAYRQKAQK